MDGESNYKFALIINALKLRFYIFLLMFREIMHLFRWQSYA